MTTDLPAGPELDLAVARSCGFQADIIGGVCCRDAPWTPSSDTSDAFEALEALGEQGAGWSTGNLENGYECNLSLDMRTTRKEVAETLTLAICRAIVATTKETKL